MTMAVPLAERTERLQALAPVDLPSADSMGSVPETAVHATLDALERGETHYTDRPGILPLRVRVGEKLSARFGLAFGEADTVITCGVTEARFVAVQELLTSDQTLFDGTGAQVLAGALIVRGASFTDDIGSAKVVYLTSTASEEEQRKLLSQARDDAFILYEVDDSTNIFHPAQLATFGKRTITIGNLCTEEGLQSWRVGFLVAPKPSAAGLRDFKQALTICTTNLSQWAALALLEQE